ncbi:hypothetical protein V6N11_058285 [Hibiscus sabdariffa]|uniref:Uncharacterized protein n=2 Tax=Hibiscus sabdariffa TaxID=183260 RepID=A0ABR1ZCC3_9ROSI
MHGNHLNYFHKQHSFCNQGRKQVQVVQIKGKSCGHLILIFPMTTLSGWLMISSNWSRCSLTRKVIAELSLYVAWVKRKSNLRQLQTLDLEDLGNTIYVPDVIWKLEQTGLREDRVEVAHTEKPSNTGEFQHTQLFCCRSFQANKS